MIEQLTARGVMAADALYEAPFTSLHAGESDALFGDGKVVDGLFGALAAAHRGLESVPDESRSGVA